MSTRSCTKALLVPILLVLGPGMGLPVAGLAAPNDIVRIEGVDYRVDHPMVDNLKALEGRSVTLYLNSGSEISGRIKAVSGELLHLERIRQREFMDALVRIGQIDALEVRFRAYERDLQRLQK